MNNMEYQCRCGWRAKAAAGLVSCPNCGVSFFESTNPSNEEGKEWRKTLRWVSKGKERGGAMVPPKDIRIANKN